MDASIETRKAALAKRFNDLKEVIADAKCFQTGQMVELLAVSKGHDAEMVRWLYELGQRRFAENYAQELHSKSQQLSDLPISWVFIGRLQSNKIKKIVELADEIQTVASYKHAAAIAQYAQQAGKCPYPIYLAVNADQEEQKDGVDLTEVLPLYQEVLSDFGAHLNVRGLMAIPAPLQGGSRDPADVPEIYAKLRKLTDHIGERQLSLGMSADLISALKAGSNLVRIGTALFGPRPKILASSAGLC